MKKPLFYLLLVSVFFSSCLSPASNPHDLLSTPSIPARDTGIDTPAPSAVPTTIVTPTPRPSLTPTLTSTPTPSQSPTPPGGGSGKLMFLQGFTLYKMNADGSDLEVLIPQERLMEALDWKRKDPPRSWALLSPDGEKMFIGICGDQACSRNNQRNYLTTTDLSVVKHILIGESLSRLSWSPDAQKMLAEVNTGKSIGRSGLPCIVIGASDADFGKPLHRWNASSAFWASDSQQINYWFRDGYYAVDYDGSGKRSLDLPSDRPSYSGGSSPDGSQIVFTYSDEKLWLANSDFSNAEELSIPGAGRADEFLWSQDYNKLFYIDYATAVGWIDLDDLSQKSLTVPKDFYPRFICNLSPDGLLILYDGWPAEGDFRVYIHNIENDQAMRLTNLESGNENCPVWLPNDH